MSDDLPMAPQDRRFWLEEHYEEVPGNDLLGTCRVCGAAVVILEGPAARDHVRWHEDAVPPQSRMDRVLGRDQVLDLMRHERVGRLPATKPDLGQLLYRTFGDADRFDGLLKQLVADGEVVQLSGDEVLALGFLTGIRGKAVRSASTYYLAADVHREAAGQAAAPAATPHPLAALFERRWVCRVVTSGFHNNCYCTPDEPHGDDWNCGWRWTAPALTDTQAAQYGITTSQEKGEPR